MTRIDDMHAAMAASPEDGEARLAFYDSVAGAELYLLLTREPDGEALDPRIFETSQGAFVLAFDRLERLTAFAGPSPYAALPGRTLAEMLAGQGAGIALNPDVAPSAYLLPPDAVAWLSGALSGAPDEIEARIAEISAPKGLPDSLLTRLDGKLATATGLARMACLAAVRYGDGGRGHALAFVGAAPGAERALARAVREALIFSGLEAGALDVLFLSGSDSLAERFGRIGLRFDLPACAARETPAAPGSDPDTPPRLR